MQAWHMLYDPPPIETARARANRIWKNAAITRNIKKPTASKKVVVIGKPVSREIALIRLKIEMRKILVEKAYLTIEKHLTIITARKKRLLKEKLRRLLMENDHV